MDPEFITIEVSALTDLLDCKREYNKICDEFKMNPEDRSKNGAADAILERVHTFLTGYILRRSVTERENGAAFRQTAPIEVKDPDHETQV